MRLLEWVREFATLHERAKYGELEANEIAHYREEREALARALLAAQKVTLDPGQKPRRTLRVAKALPIELTLYAQTVRAKTLNISGGGFAILSEIQAEIGDEVKAALHLPDDVPIHGVARVVGVRLFPTGSTRLGCQFVEMDNEDAERLEVFVFDSVLEYLKH